MQPTIGALVVAAAAVFIVASISLCQTPAGKTPAPAKGIVVPEGVKVVRDVEFAKVGAKSLLLDVYMPAVAPKEPLPLIVWIHGGQWNMVAVDKSYTAGNAVVPSAARGYVVASINYRLSQEAIFPAQIHDCKAAIRFLRAHAKEYSVDPNRIAAWGESAGGHLAALLGTTNGTKTLDGNVGDCLKESSRVQAVVDFCGPTDFPLFLKTAAPDIKNVIKGLLGGEGDSVKDLAILASPVSHASKGAAPFLIVHGSDDGAVPPSQAESLNKALADAKADVTLLIIKGARHGVMQGDVIQTANDFLDKNLRNMATTQPTR